MLPAGYDTLGGVTDWLITVSALAEALASAQPPTVLDVRWRLGGPPTRPEYLAGPIPGAAFVQIGDQFIALFERGPRTEERHFGLVVDDKEAARRALEEAGLEILPGGRLDVRDPSGNLVQIVQYDQIQFTKTDRILEGMGLELGKS